MSNVSSLGKEKKFPKNSEMLNRIQVVIDDYSDDIALVEVLGVLELIKIGMIDKAKEDFED